MRYKILGQRHYHLSIALAALLFSIFAGQVFAKRAIPADNLAYPVLITLKTAKVTGTGSGFYLHANDSLYLVTAKHVLAAGLDPDPETHQVPDAEIELLSYSPDLPTPSRNLITAGLPSLRASGEIKPHPSQDVVYCQNSNVA